MPFRKMNITHLSFFVACIAMSVSAFAQQETKGLLRQPTVSKTSVVFVYGGDLWSVPRAGGTARRLTANPSVKRYPKFSPDGKYLAFTGNYDGNSDVYVMPAEGGEPKRLTFHPYPDDVMGWTPDSKAVLFRSARYAVNPRVPRLFTVPIAGGLERPLPMPEGSLACFSPDGKQIAYNRIERESGPWLWKRYRGGAQAYLSLYDLTADRYSELPHTDTTDLFPMWRGDRIYFASDRSGTVNLFCYDLKRRAVRQITRYRDYDVKWPSLGPDAIVFEQGGLLRLLDLASERVAPLNVQVYSDRTTARPALRHVEANISNFGISPSGMRAVFEARGDLFTAPAKKGDSRDVTNSPGVREIDPAWSPDGRWIAYFSDRSGEYELYIRPQDGSGAETRLTSDGHVFRTGLAWSPDSKALLYTDASMKLWRITLAEKRPILVDFSDLAPIAPGRWSPDGKWIAYSKLFPNQNDGLMLYSVEQNKAFRVSNGRFNDHDPAFDPGGKYLYFLSERTFNPTQFASEINIAFQNLTGLFALTLRKETPSPLGPQSDEEPIKGESKGEAKPSAAAPKPDAGLKIDLDGLANRLIALPVAPGAYTRLAAGAGKVFYFGDNVLHQFDLNSRTDAVIMSGIQAYDLTPDCAKLLYHAGPVFGITDAAPGAAPGAGQLALDLEMRIDPMQEWRQMFQETWRYERDYYYDPEMHGLDWKAIGDRYARLLPNLAHRDDLTYLLSELVSELNTSHAFVFPPGPAPGAQIGVGLLGVDFEEDHDLYRLKKIYAGESWDHNRISPLTEPGLNVKEGDYLLAVNGVPLHTDANPYALFEGTVGKTVTLKLNDRPTDVGAHEIQVKTIADEHELRYLDWVEDNRRKVEAATGGRVGYFHVPDTGEGGITAFGREFYSLTDKEGLIVDERYNDGGLIPDFFVEKLARKLQAVGTSRYGVDQRFPTGAVYGPKAMLTNEWAGSGGDHLPDLFRREGVGPLIGKRTAGGLVGINGFYTLMDGGVVSAPSFGVWSPQEGRWIVENHGVDPDIEVNNPPDLEAQGRDPQLERAIAYLQDQLKRNPPPAYHHPSFPVDRLSAERKPRHPQVTQRNGN